MVCHDVARQCWLCRVSRSGNDVHLLAMTVAVAMRARVIVQGRIAECLLSQSTVVKYRCRTSLQPGRHDTCRGRGRITLTDAEEQSLHPGCRVAQPSIQLSVVTRQAWAEEVGRGAGGACPPPIPLGASMLLAPPGKC